MLGKAGLMLGGKTTAPFFQLITAIDMGSPVVNLFNKAEIEYNHSLSGVPYAQLCVYPATNNPWWNPNSGSPMFFQANWGVAATIEKVEIALGNTNTSAGYLIGTTLVEWWDGSAWQTAGTVMAAEWVTSSQYGRITFASPITTSKLKFTFTGPGAGYLYIKDMRAVGTGGGAYSVYASTSTMPQQNNIGMTANGTTWTSQRGTASTVGDGTVAQTNYWEVGISPLPLWLQADWASSKTIKKVEWWCYYWGTPYTSYYCGPTGLKFQYWDGSQWLEFARTPTTANWVGFILDTPISTNKFRMEWMAVGSANAIISEVQIFSS
jgi:hypothetical protein